MKKTIKKFGINLEIKNLGLSMSLAKILTGRDAGTAMVVEMNFIFRLLERFGLLFISQEDLSKLYFYLPEKRRVELKVHLDKIAPDFRGWKMFLIMNKQSSESIKKMALNEMFQRSENFQSFQDGFKMAEGYLEIQNKFLTAMRDQALSQEEKITVLTYEPEPTMAQIEEVFSLINDFQIAEKFVGLPKLPTAYKNKGLKKMFQFATSFPQLLRTHRRSQSGAPLRREIVRAAAEYELKQQELFDAYYSEKTRTALKRMLFTKIEKLILGIEDWLAILIEYGSDRKLKSLVIEKIRGQECTFSQFNNSVIRINDLEAKASVLEEMLSIATKDFSWLKIVCLKSSEFPKIFRCAFAGLIKVAKTAEQVEEACGLILDNRSFEIGKFLGRILELGVGFDTLEKLFFLANKENKKKLEAPLRRAAGNNFDYLNRVYHCSRKEMNRNRTLADMYNLSTGDQERLVRVYQLAFSYNQVKMAEKVTIAIKELNLNFTDLFIIHETLEKEKLLNNGLAKLIQKELALKARTEKEKTQAFEKVALENKNIILEKLMEAA